MLLFITWCFVIGFIIWLVAWVLNACLYIYAILFVIYELCCNSFGICVCMFGFSCGLVCVG